MPTLVHAGVLATVMSLVAPNAYAACSGGDLSGKWSLVGTAVSEGVSQTVWCSTKLSPKPGNQFHYSISGTCQSQSPFQTSPESFTVSGNGTVTETAACVIGGSFMLTGPSSIPVTIVTGHAEGSAPAKTNAIGVLRYPNPTPPFIGTPVLQTFTMVR